MSTFSSSPIGSGQQQIDVDTLHADNYPKPFRTRRVRSQAFGGGVKSTDLIQRMSLHRGDRGRGLMNVLVLPSVAYGETYDTLYHSGEASHEEAKIQATKAAKAALSVAGDFDKFFPKAQADWGRLQEEIEMNDPVPTPENQPLPIGASGPRSGGARKTPGGVGLSGTGTTPQARAPQQAIGRSSDGVDQEFMSFDSVDGTTYTFLKKEGGVVHAQFLPMVNALAQIEGANGGDPRTVYHASKVIFTDVNGQQLFPPVAPPAPEPEALPTGVTVG